MAEIAIAGIVFSTAATLAAPLLQHLLKKTNGGKDSTISLVDMHEVLESGLERLLAVQRDKENEVSRDIIQKDKSEVYKVWEKSVSNIKEEKDSLDKEYVKLKDKKFSLRKRPRLENKIRTALQKVVQLLEQCPEKSMVDKPTERVIKEIGVPSIAEYTRLNSALQEIQKLLQINGVKCVALHGQKGVGKTTIMKHLNNNFYDDSVGKKFDMVIFIKVPAYTQTEELEGPHILQKIAERIKVDVKDKGSDDEVARTVQGALEKKIYLLILDGVSDARTLEWIWKNLDISKGQRDSKVVITTDFPLIGNLKRFVDMKVNLERLSPDEAWDMFQNIYCGNKLPKYAQQICKRFCFQLPLFINHIAKSFSDQLFPVDWQRALVEYLPWPQVGVEGLAELYLSLELLCLKRLDKQGARKCFLYASLYPANSKICTKYFVECCIAQGFLDDVDADTYSEMRRRAIDTTLKYLVNVAFLEEEEEMRYVKMDGFYRDFALHISSKDSDSKCRTYVDKEEHDERRPVRPESWQHVRWVSMIGTKRDSLTTTQDCKSLQTLLLQKNMKLVNIPSNYFKSMSGLLVLNLYCTKINNLPSLKGLTKLKALYLNGCSELKIESCEIKSLKHLEIFDIRDTRVHFVPCLESLRCLRISYIGSCDKSGDPGNYHPISMLHKLEELTIEVKSPQQWYTNAKRIIEKVASLEYLTTFRCRFPSSETLKKFLETSKSWREKQSVHFNLSCDVKNQSIQESLSLLTI